MLARSALNWLGVGVTEGPPVHLGQPVPVQGSSEPEGLRGLVAVWSCPGRTVAGPLLEGTRDQGSCWARTLGHLLGPWDGERWRLGIGLGVAARLRAELAPGVSL